MDSVYADIMDELNSRETYKHEIYAPYYIASYGTHCFNLMNQREKIYWDGKRLPNMRMHVLFVAPPGFMKSHYLGIMGGDDYSIFRNTGVDIGAEQSMCLPAGERVTCEDGSRKNIEDVEIGDVIMSYYRGAVIPTEVVRTHLMDAKKLLHITLRDGRQLTCTPNHPVYTLHGWKEPKELVVGESIAVVRKYDTIGIDTTPRTDNASIGSVPPRVYDIIEDELHGMSWTELGKLTGLNIVQAKNKGNKLRREWLESIARILSSDRLLELASPHIAWMEVKSIEELPGDIVYNVTTENSTFIANDIVTHNTEAGFIGTIVNINGIGTPTEGAAMTFKQGMLMIDEFSAITNALKVQYNSQLDTQLLAALDHGRVFKRLGGGKIEYTTNLTLWAGVQPARYDMTSGLGRRLCYLLFLPTRQDNDLLMETMHRTRNIAPVDSDMLKLRERISKWKESMNIIKRVEFSDSVLNKYKELGLFSYESSYFDRILLGWHLAVYGADTTMYIDVKDNEIDTIIKREKKWRDTIGKGVDYAQLMKLITMFGGQISQAELVEEAIMIGWNAQQVYEMVAEMNRYKLIGISGDIISIKSSKHYQL